MSVDRFPFSALVGQQSMTLALTLVAVNPAIGGLLLRGEKGTAKSTAARALAGLLPPRPDGRAAPFVELPLGATLDRVAGALDLESTIREGRARLQPGLLAAADQGILYVDEVNLLDESLSEAILDAAESGINRVERDGVSHAVPARFVLIGTMNPEEGEVRPQLLDRFGLAVRVAGESAPETRVALMRAREAFDSDPAGFAAHWAEAAPRLAERIAAARRLLPHVVLPSVLCRFVAEIARRNHVAGHRADLAIERAARALAAWEGRDTVTDGDIARVAPLALLHRVRGAAPDRPPPPPSDPTESEPPSPEDLDADPPSAGGAPEPSDRVDPDDAPPPSGQGQGEQVQAVGETFTVRRLAAEASPGGPRLGSGRRSRAASATRQGRVVGDRPDQGTGDVALFATLRAAAPHQARRRAAGPGPALRVRPEDVRENRRVRRVGSLLLFVVDGSGSMGAHRRMEQTKAAILSLLLDAYQKRDRVAMVVFRGQGAETVLPPTGSVERAARLLADLPVGGRTPLSAGLAEAAHLLARTRRRDPAVRPLVLVLTDGRANAGLGAGPPHEEALRLAAHLADAHPQARFLVVDTGVPGLVHLDLASRLARALGGVCLATDDLDADQLVSLAKEFRS